MKRISKVLGLALMLWSMLMTVPISAFADGILGDNVMIQYRFPTITTVFGLNATGVVTNTGVALNLFGNQIVTVFPNFVQMIGIRNSNFISTAFNGVSIQDLTNPSAFTGFSIDPATNIAGFSISNVSLVSGVLFINYQGLFTPLNSLAQVDFTPTSVPEPSTMFLLGSGLIGLVGFRRKLRK